MEAYTIDKRVGSRRPSINLPDPTNVPAILDQVEPTAIPEKKKKPGKHDGQGSLF